jgi:hypothetical protein
MELYRAPLCASNLYPWNIACWNALCLTMRKYSKFGGPWRPWICLNRTIHAFTQKAAKRMRELFDVICQLYAQTVLFLERLWSVDDSSELWYISCDSKEIVSTKISPAFWQLRVLDLKVKRLMFYWDCTWLFNHARIYPTWSSACFLRIWDNSKLVLLLFEVFGHIQSTVDKQLYLTLEISPSKENYCFWRELFSGVLFFSNPKKALCAWAIHRRAFFGRINSL